jgi:hypothetical protein
MGVTMIVLEVLLGLAFLGFGGMKVSGNEKQKQEFKRFGYPLWFMHLTGLLELTGAFGMLAGVFLAPMWGAVAGLLLAAVMVGAIATHIRVKDPVGKLVPPSVLLVLALAVSAIYFFV